MEKLIILGAGGHARSVMDILLQNNDFEIIGCIDPSSSEVLDQPVIGNDNDLEALYLRGIKKIFVAIGDNHLRDRLFKKVESIGFQPINVISRHAMISPRANLGKGICIMAGAVINVNTVIEDNTIINTHCSIDHDCDIGRSAHIAPGVALSGTVKIGTGVQVGTGASVIDGITIGDWAFIGGGAAVVSDIPEGVLAYGVPARIIRKISTCEES
jgi:UDP-perosamine 4-acetyltransferase